MSRRGLMVDPMLYPVWQMLPRAAHLLQDWRLNRLLASNYDPGAGQRPDRHFWLPRSAKYRRRPIGLASVPAAREVPHRRLLR